MMSEYFARHGASESSMTSTFSANPCKHSNGHEYTVGFLGVFWKKIYICFDCGSMFHGKRLAEIKRGWFGNE